MGYRKVSYLEQIWYIIKAAITMRRKNNESLHHNTGSGDSKR